MRADVSRDRLRQHGTDAVCYQPGPDEAGELSQRLTLERRARVRVYRVRLHVHLLRLFEAGPFDPREDG